MPTDEFEENFDFVRQAQAEGLNEESFRKYIEAQGHDFAKGFFAAMKYMAPKVRSVYRTPSVGDIYSVNTRAEMRDKAMGLESHIDQFLLFASTSDILPDKDTAKLPRQSPQ